MLSIQNYQLYIKYKDNKINQLNIKNIIENAHNLI